MCAHPAGFRAATRREANISTLKAVSYKNLLNKAT
jgi:hypothetical protein